MGVEKKFRQGRWILLSQIQDGQTLHRGDERGGIADRPDCEIVRLPLDVSRPTISHWQGNEPGSHDDQPEEGKARQIRGARQAEPVCPYS